MQNPAPTTKERLALLRFEVICHIKTLRHEGMPLAECLRRACSRPWPGEDGLYYSYRTIETWWYGHARHGFPGLAGKATYRLRVHGSTNMSPHERFTRAGHPLRPIEEPEKIDALFYTRIERVVRKDGTVTLGKKLLEVNLALRALTVELRYDPVLFDRVEVWHKGSFHGLARLADLHLNSTIAHQHRGTNYAR